MATSSPGYRENSREFLGIVLIKCRSHYVFVHSLSNYVKASVTAGLLIRIFLKANHLSPGILKTGRVFPNGADFPRLGKFACGRIFLRSFFFSRFNA